MCGASCSHPPFSNHFLDLHQARSLLCCYPSFANIMSTAYFDEEEKGSDGLIRQGTSAAPMQIQTSDEWQQENRTPTQKLVVMVGGFSVLIMCLVFLNNLSGKPSENVSPTSNLIAVLDPSRLARPFSVWDSSPTPYNWCVPGTLYSDTQKEGLFYVKVPKGASSTLLGVVMRIADKMGARLYGNTSIENTCMNRGHPHRRKYRCPANDKFFYFQNTRLILFMFHQMPYFMITETAIVARLFSFRPSAILQVVLAAVTFTLPQREGLSPLRRTFCQSFKTSKICNSSIFRCGRTK